MLIWYKISHSDRQLEDLKFLFLDKGLDIPYIKSWVQHLKLDSDGILQ